MTTMKEMYLKKDPDSDIEDDKNFDVEIIKSVSEPQTIEKGIVIKDEQDRKEVENVNLESDSDDDVFDETKVIEAKVKFEPQEESSSHFMQFTQLKQEEINIKSEDPETDNDLKDGEDFSAGTINSVSTPQTREEGIVIKEEQDSKHEDKKEVADVDLKLGSDYDVPDETKFIEAKIKIEPQAESSSQLMQFPHLKQEEIDIKSEDSESDRLSDGSVECEMGDQKKTFERKMYECEVCHSKSEIQTYKCEICPFEAKDIPQLKQHELVHKNKSEVRMYKCEMCPYETRRVADLKKHLLVHKDKSKVQMNKCEMCPYETKHIKNFETHMLVHKRKSEVRTYICEGCSFESKNLRYLVHHKVVYKYKCETCPFKTKRVNDLKKHLLVHKDKSEVKVHKCELCAFETRNANSLRKHMLVHKDKSEVRMCKCKVCPFETRYPGSLRKHMRIHMYIYGV